MAAHVDWEGMRNFTGSSRFWEFPFQSSARSPAGLWTWGDFVPWRSLVSWVCDRLSKSDGDGKQEEVQAIPQRSEAPPGTETLNSSQLSQRWLTHPYLCRVTLGDMERKCHVEEGGQTKGPCFTRSRLFPLI